MLQQVTAQKRADYGIDAPGVARGLAAMGILGVVLGIVVYLVLKPVRSTLATILLIIGLLFGLYGLFSFIALIWSSKIGKFRLRDRMIDSIPWRGDETVLDVGCGRGLLLIAAAKRLTTGKAIGIDIWSAKDQSANRPEATWENARIEDVVDRIEVKHADAQHLPFEDSTFDVIISSLVIHNIENRAGRDQAIREIARVLKPGGHAAILDILHTSDYAQVMRESGLADVQLSKSTFLFFSPVTRIVMSTKPAVH